MGWNGGFEGSFGRGSSRRSRDVLGLPVPECFVLKRCYRQRDESLTHCSRSLGISNAFEKLFGMEMLQYFSHDSEDIAIG